MELYLQMRMKLRKVHRALGFDQKARMKEYIDEKKELRKQPKNDFDIRYSTKAFIQRPWKDPGGQRKVYKTGEKQGLSYFDEKGSGWQ